MAHTERDEMVFGAIRKFKALSISQIHQLKETRDGKTYTYATGTLKFVRDRMKALTDRKEVKRLRNHMDQEYVYYFGKCPIGLPHTLKIADVYLALGQPEVYMPEFTIGNVRADAYAEVIRNGKLYLFFVEVEDKNPMDYLKYIKLYQSGLYKKYTVFPRIIVVSRGDPQPPEDTLTWKSVRWDLSDIDSVFD